MKSFINQTLWRVPTLPFVHCCSVHPHSQGASTPALAACPESVPGLTSFSLLCQLNGRVFGHDSGRLCCPLSRCLGRSCMETMESFRPPSCPPDSPPDLVRPLLSLWETTDQTLSATSKNEICCFLAGLSTAAGD